MDHENPFDRYEKILKGILPALPAETRLNPSDRLAELGLDSLLLVQLVVQIEEGFQISLTDDLLTQETFESVDSLWTVVSALREMAEEFDDPLVS